MRKSRKTRNGLGSHRYDTLRGTAQMSGGPIRERNRSRENYVVNSHSFQLLSGFTSEYGLSTDFFPLACKVSRGRYDKTHTFPACPKTLLIGVLRICEIFHNGARQLSFLNECKECLVAQDPTVVDYVNRPCGVRCWLVEGPFCLATFRS